MKKGMVVSLLAAFFWSVSPWYAGDVLAGEKAFPKRVVSMAPNITETNNPTQLRKSLTQRRQGKEDAKISNVFV